MIWYRRIAQFVSTNKRSIFCDALKLSSMSDESINKFVEDNCKNGITKTKKLQYQMLHFGDNLQVLQVTDPPLNPASKPDAGCCILVGAGTEDSPDKCLGLAHLLEHLVVQSSFDLCSASIHGLTRRFQTFYQFEAPTEDIAKVIETYATVLFGAPKFPKSYAIKLIKVERGMLDNEFHEKRAITHNGSPFEILKSPHVRLQVMKFGAGTETTLSLNDDDLIKELVALRKLYRQRRVAICIYSPEKIEMKTIVDSLNVGDFLIPESITAPLRLGYEKRKDCKDMSKTLIVLKSEYDTRLLTLIFPIMDELNIQQRNTIEYILRMIMCTSERLLIFALRNRNLATKCKAMFNAQNIVIEVNLTEEGLKQIQYVNDCIKNFLQFLHDKWETDMEKYVHRMKENSLRRFDSLPNEKKAEFIVTHLDGSSKEYDEMDLHKDLGVEEAKKLISTHLLKNENTVHMIYDHNPIVMLQHLKKEYGDCFPEEQSLETMEPHKEPFYGREFYVVESTVFEPRKDDPQAGFNHFQFITLKIWGSTIKDYATPIFEPKDTAFRKLFAVHFHFFFDPYNGFFNGTITGQLPEIFQHEVRNEAEFYFSKKKWVLESEEYFSLAKESHLADLSSEMSKSQTLAESLMTVIVNNLSGSLKLDPLPLEYDTLLKTDYEGYCRYIRGVEEKQKTATPRTQTTSLKYVETKLHSINRNEGVTATLVFYQTSQLLLSQLGIQPQHGDMNIFASAFWKEAFKMKREHAIYTLMCTPHQFGHVHGFLCKILSVESKHGQDSKSIDVICQNILKGVEKRLEDYGRYYELQRMFNSMKETYVKVQVVGYNEPEINKEGTFKEQFKNWFLDREKIFEDIRNLQ